MNKIYSIKKFNTFVKCLKRKISVNKKDIIFICIGTNLIMGDSLGPKVGDFLKKNLNSNLVIGSTKNNICKKNDLLVYNKIIQDKFIIAIDSAFSIPELRGEIFISEGPICMGSAFTKNCETIGDLSIKAVVSELTDNKFEKINNLSKIDKLFINNLSLFIGNGIIKAISE